jgi:DNA recombination protein RmuC
LKELLEALLLDQRLLFLSLALLLLVVLGGFLLVRMRYQSRLAQVKLEHNREIGEWQTEVSRLEERLAGETQAAADKLELLQGARKQMSEEFNNLANRIFEEKSQRLLENSKNTLQHTLTPLQNQLQEFRKRVDHVYDTESRDRVSLMHELNQLKQLNKQMSEDAVNLTRALKGDKKTQGNWGEVVLERVLEESGLRKGYEYETQVSLQSAGGKRRMPDVVVRLPEEKDIIIDAKVSLVDYSRYVASDDETEKRSALAAHVQAIKNHITGLSIKDYDGLEGVRTLDFVLMFIPIESAFMAAFDSEPEMFRTAYDKQVIVVSPTTLLATLRTVQSIWRYEQQNKNAEKIANQAGAIHDQFALVLESLSEVGKHLDRARGSWDKTRDRLNSGRGNLVRKVQLLQELGARTRKTLPPDMADSDTDDAARLTNTNPDEETPE